MTKPVGYGEHISTDISSFEKRIVANMITSGKTASFTSGRLFEIRFVEKSILVKISSRDGVVRAVI